MRNIHKINTISDSIDYGKKLDFSHSKFHLKAKVDGTDKNDIIVNYSSIIVKYIDYLDKYIVDVTLSDEEFIKYKFQPKLLSLDLYKTTELWSAILVINHIPSCMEFTNQKLKLFTDNIFDFLNEMIILEDRQIKRNNAEIE